MVDAEEGSDVEGEIPDAGEVAGELPTAGFEIAGGMGQWVEELVEAIDAGVGEHEGFVADGAESLLIMKGTKSNEEFLASMNR